MELTYMEQRYRVAWIGTGVMGSSMAGHLLAAGHEVIVHSRTKSKAAGLLEGGATWADTPAIAADGSDFAVSIVGYPDDVEQVHLGPAGTLAAKHPPRTIIDMTTSRPSLAVKIAQAARSKNIGSLDAPVSGGDVGARNATLSIMVGGEQVDFDQAMPLFRAMGKNIVRLGPPGAGQHTKMVNQILIASTLVGVCEGLMYAKRAGLDAMNVIEAVGGGAAGSWQINNLGPRIVKGDFNPGFYVEHFTKDLGIALEEAERMQLDLAGLQLAKRLFDEVSAQGHGRLGTQSLFLTMEQKDKEVNR